MKVYIAGPMTGIPQFNFPAFANAAALLRAEGMEVISPHEQDTPAVQAVAWQSPDGKLDAAGKVGGETWGDILAKDVKMLADGGIEGIVFLPDWQKSRGARLEATVGLLCKLKFSKLHYTAERFEPVVLEMTPLEVAAELFKAAA